MLNFSTDKVCFILDTPFYICYIRFEMRNEDQKPEYKWEHFEQPTRAERTELYVSIYRNGLMSMNDRTYQAFGRPEYLSLMYDPNYEVIGVRGVERLTPGAVKIRPKTNYRALHLLPIAQFLRHFDIKLGYTVRFTDPQIDDGVMILDLHKTARVLNSGRKKKIPQE